MRIEQSSAAVPNQQGFEGPISAHRRQVVGEQQRSSGVNHFTIEADHNLVLLGHGLRAYWPASYS